MRWQYALIGFSVLIAGAGFAAEWEQPYPKLGACTKKDSMALRHDRPSLHAMHAECGG